MSDISPWQLFILGGPLMWPILLCSVFAMTVVIEKLLFFNSINDDMTELKNRIFGAVRRNDIKGALEACDRSLSPTAKVLKAGLLKYGRARAEVVAAMQEAARFEVPRLEQRLPALSAVGNIAPLLGLLGTVMGMCMTFHIMQVRAAAMNPVMPIDVAAGVWQALITTAAGLVVAIPVFLAHGYLAGFAQKYALQMERTAADLADFLTQDAGIPGTATEEAS